MTTNHPGASAPDSSGSYPPPWQQPGYAPPQPPAPQRSWFSRHKVLTVFGTLGIVVLLATVAGVSGSGYTPPAAALTDSPPAAEPEDAVDPEPTSEPEVTSDPEVTGSGATTAAPAPTPKLPAKPRLTVGQEQAIGAAKDYLDTSAFSRLGLIEQLSSAYGSGFSKADATFAVDHLNVNWKEQAVLAAKEYLASSHFSRAGLIQQLSSAYGSRFTRAEATYAADKVGL